MLGKLTASINFARVLIRVTVAPVKSLPTLASFTDNKIDRKSTENRDVVQFELASVFDLAGIRAGRQCTRTEFPSIGTAIG